MVYEQHEVLLFIICKILYILGWIGIIVLVLSCVAVGWCGVLLGKCWLMLEERFPEYQDHCRDPYPSIGYEAFGKPGK